MFTFVGFEFRKYPISVSEAGIMRGEKKCLMLLAIATDAFNSLAMRCEEPIH